MRFVLPAIAALTACAMSTPAAALETIWFDSDNTAYSGDYASGASLVFSGGGVNVRASAWSINGSGVINQASLGVWSPGLGVMNGAGDNSHTIDNSGFRDFILLQFDKTVELEYAQFRTGWHGMNDTDATIGYAASALPFGAAPALNGQLESALGGLGLSLYSSNAPSGDSFRAINPAGRVGNLWLIGASFDNPAYLDGFKLEKLKFSTPAVPEPSTWAMMIVGFGLLGGVMRAQRRKTPTVTYA